MDTVDEWNLKTIMKPPEISVLYQQTELRQVTAGNKDGFGDQWLQKVIGMLEKFVNEMHHSDHLLQVEEEALLAFLYQNGRHRNEKFLQIIKKVTKCVKRWEDLKVIYLLSNILQMLPSESPCMDQIRLPSTKSLHFALLRLVGAFYLLLRVSSYCLQAATFLRPKLSTGHCFGTVTVFYAFVSRIRALSIDIAGIISTYYENLFSWVEMLCKIYPVDDMCLLPQSLKGEFRKSMDYSEKIIGDSLTQQELDDEGRRDRECTSNADEFEKSSSLLTTKSEDDIGEWISYEKFSLIERIAGNTHNANPGNTRRKSHKEISKCLSESPVRCLKKIGSNTPQMSINTPRMSTNTPGINIPKMKSRIEPHNETAEENDNPILKNGIYKKKSKVKFNRKLVKNSESNDDSRVHKKIVKTCTKLKKLVEKSKTKLKNCNKSVQNSSLNNEKQFRKHIIRKALKEGKLVKCSKLEKVKMRQFLSIKAKRPISDVSSRSTRLRDQVIPNHFNKRRKANKKT